MIILDLEQNTPEWHAARLGCVTASMMDKIITPTGKPSSSSNGYMNQLLADWYAGHQVDAFEGNRWTEQGHEREAECRALYEFMTDREVKQVGFVKFDEQTPLGCSPDGLVGEGGLLEIKNPKGSTVIEYMLKGGMPAKYKPQVQAQLFLCDRQWCDFMYRHPDIGEQIVTVERDEAYVTLMLALVFKFIEKMLKNRNILGEYKNV